MTKVLVERRDAAIVFGIAGALCSATVFLRIGSFNALMMVAAIVAAFSAAVTSCLFMPCWRYRSIFQATCAGVCVALLSNVVMSTTLILLLSIVQVSHVSELLTRTIGMTLMSLEVAWLPQIALGGIAGAVCYLYFSTPADTPK